RGPVEFPGAEEAEAEQIPRAKHSRGVFEFPATDVIRRAEVFLGSGGTSDAPCGAAGGDVELEKRPLIVGSKRVQLLELLLRRFAGLPEPAEPEKGPAARQMDLGLEFRRGRSEALLPADRLEDGREASMGQHFVQAADEAFGVDLLALVFLHASSGSGPNARPKAYGRGFRAALAERDPGDQSEIGLPGETHVAFLP